MPSYAYTRQQLEDAAVDTGDLPGSQPGVPQGPPLLYPCTDTPTFSDGTTSPGKDIGVGRTLGIGTRVGVLADESPAWANRRIMSRGGCTFTHGDGAVEKVDSVEQVTNQPADKLYQWSVRFFMVFPDGRGYLAQSTYVQKGRLAGVVECSFAADATAGDVATCGNALRALTAGMIALLKR